MKRTHHLHTGNSRGRARDAVFVLAIAAVLLIAGGCATGRGGVVVTGTIEVRAWAAGVLYVDGSPVAELAAGERHVQEVQWGTVRLQMQFAGGGREARQVTVATVETVRVDFGYGRIEVIAPRAGSVWVDNREVGAVSGGDNVTVEVFAGERDVEMRYEGKTETITVNVEATKSVTARFDGPVYRIGESGPAGGVVFYAKGEYSHGWRYLEAWTRDQTGTRGWNTIRGNFPSTPGTSTAIGSGFANTYSALSGSMYEAAQTARNATHGGYTDWFLPSKDELSRMYASRAVLGGFVSASYWSSSEDSSDFAWAHHFPSGSPGRQFKRNTLQIRVIRAF